MAGLAAVVDTVPRSGATNVPVDLRLAAVFEGDCGGPSTVTLVLTQADDGTEVATTSLAWTGASGQIYELFPDAELSPETEYVFTVLPDDGSGEVTEIGFTTGTGRVSGFEGMPALVIESATSSRDSGVILTTGTLSAAEDPERLSLIVMTASGAGSGSAVVSMDGAGARQDTWTGGAGELCVQVTQIDATGLAVDGEPACAEVEVTGSLFGCNSAGAGASALGVLLAIGLVRRR